MQKIAQKRSILNKLRENTSIEGIAAEKFFNPEFQKVMESLRSADNKIRSIATGTDIEGESGDSDSTSLKDLLKSAKSNLNRREYMTALAFLGRFHKKIESIAKFIEQLKFDVDQVHHDFLFKDLDEDKKKYLNEIKGRFATSTRPTLIAQAGILDFLSNIGTARGRALAAWEKRYPRQVKQIKKDIGNIYARSEVMLSNLLSSLKTMANARALRKIDDYMDGANKIVSHYGNYDKQFKDYYSGELKSFLSKQELLAPTKKVEESKELGKQDVGAEKVPSIDEPGSGHIDIPNSSSGLPAEPSIPLPLVQKNTLPPPAQKNPGVEQTLEDESTPTSIEDMYNAIKTPGSLPAAPVGPTMPSPAPGGPPAEEEPDTIKDLHPEMIPPSAAHKRFMDSLKVLGSESPEFLASHISRYAKSIISSDPETAIQLFNVVKSIKKAG